MLFIIYIGTEYAYIIRHQRDHEVYPILTLQIEQNDIKKLRIFNWFMPSSPTPGFLIKKPVFNGF